MDNKKDGSCQYCDKVIGAGNNGQNENGKQFCCMGCLKAYREAKENASKK